MCQENLHVTLLPVPGARLCVTAVVFRAWPLFVLAEGSIVGVLLQALLQHRVYEYMLAFRT